MNAKTRNSILDTVAELRADDDFFYVAVNRCVGGGDRNTNLRLADGQIIEAVVRAEDVLGNFTVVLRDGGIRQYLSEEVA
jgi:hypothetical protein